MQVTVRLFASLREAAGWSERQIAMPQNATVDALLARLAGTDSFPDLSSRPFYVAVNQAYAHAGHHLSDGDVVALFPPVSGGRPSHVCTDVRHSTGLSLRSPSVPEFKLFEITQESLSLDDVVRRVNRPDCGGVATFAGIVRGVTTTAKGGRETDFLAYEAYAEMAESTMAQIGDEIRERWPKVKAVSILHKVGHCSVGEPSVVIAVATPHRDDGCFEACRYAIERLKAIVPIWKQENWSDGQVWVEGPSQPGLEIPAADETASTGG